MASPQSHRSSASVSSNSLAPPPPTAMYKQQPRRTTSPSLPPPSPIDIPQPVYGNNQGRRPPSPLRNGFTVDPDSGEIHSEDGSEDEDDEDRDRTWGRSHSPNPSITQYATSFAQRVGSFVNGVGSRSPLPTDAELEAEAERERDRSRREAERILTQEAEERRAMEERVLAMLQGTDSSPRATPPTRSQTMPPMDASPSASQKDGITSWWSAAKNRLTPTKEPLTPAQQVVQEAKEKEKKEKKEARKADKKRSGEWPASPERKFNDPTFLSLATPPGPSPRRATPASPSSPTPGAAVFKPSSLPASLAPSPLRSNDGHASSPSREAPPLYAQFNSQGTLDMPGTLLVIAKRFEKLEKWTVGHVRALEERMGDVERWLVEKESEKEALATHKEEEEVPEAVDHAMNELREEIVELQGRIGELGREMAKLATAPANLSSGPSRTAAAVSAAPATTSSIVVHSHPTVSSPQASTPRVASTSTPRRRDSMSPTFIPPSVAAAPTPRSRLPYPTGDYATPPDTISLSQGVFSPPNSPPSSAFSATHNRPGSVSGLPSSNSATSSSSYSLSGLPRTTSPSVGSPSPSGLSAPQNSKPRASSISPTPRKRYTVALGQPIMKAVDRDAPMLSASPGPMSDDLPDDSDSGAENYDDTIGKSSGRYSIRQTSADTSPSPSPQTSPPNTKSRARPQSMYSQPGGTNPLRLRIRSQSIQANDRVGLGITEDGKLPPITPLSGKFVDPLLVRKQEKQALASAAPPAPKAAAGKRKVPVGELVAYFDKDRV
ncbi:hypothetical protein BV25DRAFT_1825481 [Artomyces pyxidatus]|uniref:Uncharacterized protein n=1 Tax=Artomyces pyxidatus TaxID=48021 RepID=A0ACB8T190_9AGAM|nr:hypothetical protein BV25DRAFT_1825481 [Artomyces pyxidatus]